MEMSECLNQLFDGRKFYKIRFYELVPLGNRQSYTLWVGKIEKLKVSKKKKKKGKRRKNWNMSSFKIQYEIAEEVENRGKKKSF